MFINFYKLIKEKLFSKFIFCLFVSQIILLNFGFLSHAEAPKNYLKGKFYESVENNFLVSTEKMPDERFKETVILMISSNKEGAWGLVINKQIGSVPLKALVDVPKDIKDKEKDLYEIYVPIFWGGPVEVNQIFVLHSNEYKSETTKKYNNFSLTRDKKIFFDIANQKGPKRNLIVLGYAGWGDGQLEGEMEMDHWALSKIEDDIIFEEKIINKWRQTIDNSFIRL